MDTGTARLSDSLRGNQWSIAAQLVIVNDRLEEYVVVPEEGG